VSQWISGGRIFGPALVGEGRYAKIDVAVAEAQLGLTLDPGQQMARGGRPTASAAMPEAAPRPSPAEDHMSRYQKARADSAEIETERMRRRELAERGVYMVAEDARAAWSKEVSDLVQAVEQWLPDLAQELMGVVSADGTVDAKALTVALRKGWRGFRARRADLARSVRDAEPELTTETTE
jgi:hypothetical protein